jgi:triacylglycerol lipase
MSILVSFPIETYEEHGAGAFKGFAPKAEFTIENARALMWFTQLAYEYDADKPTKIAAMQALWQFDRITPFEAKRGGEYDTHGIIGERSDAVLLAFCGTDPLVVETVVTDARAKLNPQDIHEGFAEAAAAEDVTKNVTQAIDASRQTDRPLIIAGHSLGAAIASLAALHALEEKKHPPLAVYTYGMPRTGGATFKARYDKPLGNATYRLVNGPDVVPTVPLPVAGYRHVGRLLWCGTNKRFDRAGLLQTMESNKPKLPQSLLKTAAKGFSCLMKCKLCCSPQGPGPLGRLFKCLPLNIRVHLQDQYLNALGSDIHFDDGPVAAGTAGAT